jgi:hypothetical protein
MRRLNSEVGPVEQLEEDLGYPFKTMATVAVPTLTRTCKDVSRASRESANPISRHTPATIPRWSKMVQPGNLDP